MKLATFEFEGKESWGIVLNNPAEDRLWIYEPGKVDKELQLSATPTNGYSVSMPKFMPESKWPETLTEFLALEDEGMETLQRLERFLIRFLEQSDEARMCYAGHPLEEVQLKAPIPRPRLMWGLVQNCPTFIRSNPARQSTNLFPMGHQRPCGAVVGHNQLFCHPEGSGTFGFNVELGVVIGKKGRYIPVNKALEYVAGYTVVIDSSTDGYGRKMDPDKLGVYSIAEKLDWYVGATCSWAGKMTDAHCTMGPWIATKDEIGNIYDLNVYTKMNGRLRDRAHTSAHLLGVERVIQWYSSFATLYPGDVLHLGTLGTDGLKLPADHCFNGPDATIESEIEAIGLVKSPVLNPTFGDWREDDDVTKTIHVSPAVRDVIAAGQDKIESVNDWSLEETRHFWTLFKNYDTVDVKEGITKLPTPRFLAAPMTALGLSGAEVELPPRSNDLEISVELGVVVKKIAKEVTEENAEEYVLGYTPMISITDSSFDDVLIEPTTLQERGLPLVYGRWADGFNTVLEKPVAMTWNEALNSKMQLTVDGKESVEGNTSEYVAGIKESLSFITSYITMFPGDVMTLGCIGNRITVKKDEVYDGMKIKASIEGMGEIAITLKKSDGQDTAVSFNMMKL